MEQVKWFDRNFNFEFSQNIFPSILERLSGTPLRLEEKFKSIPPGILTRSINNTWSIKENAGHLTDLEPLWQGRLRTLFPVRKCYARLICKTIKPTRLTIMKSP